ncbi:MAG: Asp-tRNA(Asn)/Glu-tRNA(Gln) amidotransferase GatCAB subunit B [Fluviicola sp. XM-24bin1]|nr:MAG: Asp-tRNA(Asn)/Glu-tRNA(Gln) amidotransferase GatCAB subunit B [Fluviicola sp. XM-24bin1]
MNPETRSKYQAVIGLEVHAQMLTKTKAYSNDVNEFGATPNTNVSAITLGHPGTLPRMNKQTIQYAIRLGLACESNIAPEQHFARKNYFYPDLPKGYQITQDTTPICTEGRIIIKDESGEEKSIGITRIHMEEDAGKSMHDVDLYDTLVDLNRAGVPLLEIVSEPDIRSSQEAYNYVSEVRRLVRYLDICDGNMEEGSLRCDANISVMLKDATEFGTKVEVKNMNSIRNVQKAIEFEIERQIEAVEAGETISQETRSFDALKGITISMRSKEAANDYRYFPEPDLLPITVSQEQIEAVRGNMPPLPRELFLKYTNEFGLSEYDASNLTDNKDIALFYEEIIEHTKNYKGAANWVMGDIKSFLNNRGLEIAEFPISAKNIAALIQIIDDGKISSSVASQKVFPAMLEAPEKDPLKIAEELNVIQDSNEDAILTFIDDVIKQHPEEAARYKDGEKQLVGFFMGQLMRASKGQADPKVANGLMRKRLEEL